jgi:hypothetical protein
MLGYRLLFPDTLLVSIGKSPLAHPSEQRYSKKSTRRDIFSSCLGSAPQKKLGEATKRPAFFSGNFGIISVLAVISLEGFRSSGDRIHLNWPLL